jgi:hypothetical protein
MNMNPAMQPATGGCKHATCNNFHAQRRPFPFGWRIMIPALFGLAYRVLTPRAKLDFVFFFASSHKSVGQFRDREFAKLMIQQDFHHAETA